MKKVLLLLFLNSSLLTLNCFSQQYGWVALNPPSIPGTPDLSDLYFKNDSTEAAQITYSKQQMEG
jgi:hypothetical protein